ASAFIQAAGLAPPSSALEEPDARAPCRPRRSRRGPASTLAPQDRCRQRGAVETTPGAARHTCRQPLRGRPVRDGLLCGRDGGAHRPRQRCQRVRGEVSHHQGRPMGRPRSASDAVSAHPALVARRAHRVAQGRSLDAPDERHLGHPGLHHIGTSRQRRQRAGPGGMIGVMLYMNWHLTLVALATAPILVMIAFVFSRRIKKASRAVRTKESELLSGIADVLSSIHLVQAFGREDYEDRRFASDSRENVEAGLQARSTKATLSPAVELTVALGTGLVLWYGARLALSGQLSAGELIVF